MTEATDAPFYIEFPTLELARAAAEDIHTRTRVIVAITSHPPTPDYYALLALAQMAERGNTDADDLARCAANVLAGRDIHERTDEETTR